MFVGWFLGGVFWFCSFVYLFLDNRKRALTQNKDNLTPQGYIFGFCTIITSVLISFQIPKSYKETPEVQGDFSRIHLHILKKKKDLHSLILSVESVLPAAHEKVVINHLTDEITSKTSITLLKTSRIIHK